MGANVKRLFLHILAREAIPSGGGLQAGVNYLTNPDVRHKINLAAIITLDDFLKEMKAAPDNPFGDDDEVISEAFLKALDEAESK